MTHFNSGSCSDCGANVPDGLQNKHRNFHQEVEQMNQRLAQLERKVAERS